MAKAWKTFSLVAVVVLVSSLVAIASPAGAQASPSSTGDMEFTLYAGDYEIVEDDGGDVIQMEGFSTTASAGNPTLPHNVFNIVVPPDIDWESLQLEVISAETTTLKGTYDIGPAALPVAQQEGGALVDGKNMDVYGNDADFPENYVSLLPYSQMRKWSFTRVDFTPFQYNPVSGELTFIESVTIAISYEQTGAGLGESLLRDSGMDVIASETFLNYEDAKGWYEPDPIVPQTIEPQAWPGYVIITTNDIYNNSTKLNPDFINHKESLGFNVWVVTEDDYGVLTGESPDTRAERIRQWLINNYSSYGIEYVLLIGDPTPGDRTGTVDIPMQMCHPEANHSYNPGDFVPTPTDYYYADLTGDWDHDDDTLFGEWSDDYPVSGGVDFTPEVYVGRIPVYSTDYTALDSILQKVIDYETAGGALTWRQNILLPMGFQHSTGPYDGAVLGEQMKTDYLNGAGYSSWRMYQQSETDPCSLDSAYTSEEGLNGGTSAPSVFDRWTGASGTPNDFGIVCWWAHGSPTTAAVGYGGCWDGTLFQSSWCSSLDDSHPAFTYQCSCTNGHPETTNNLQYSILEQGGIATVSATRVSWFLIGQTDFTNSPTNSGLGYEYVKRLVNTNKAGYALYGAKSFISIGTTYPHYLMNWYDFNLYGDPSVGIEPIEEPEYDFGDAPDIPYPTYLANNGARHLVPVEGAIWMGPSLVNNTDLEYDGQPTNQDDVVGNDDEDGVTFLGSSPVSGGPYSLPYIPGEYGAVRIEVHGTGFPGCLHGWIDWDQDGDWENSPDPENIFTSELVSVAGTYTFEFTVPADALGGTTWGRFRLDEESVPSGELEPGVPPPCWNDPTGEAYNGEVEDYPVEIGAPDIRVDPTEICLVLPPDTIWTGTLTIYNDGDADLDYSISEQPVPSSSSTELPPGLSIEPVSAVLELPPDFEYSAVEPESPVPSVGWEYLIMDGFEGTWNWDIYFGGTEAYWGQEDCRADGPTNSAYCAAAGAAAVDPCTPADYPNDMDSWMVAGPFSLEDAIAAEFNFSLWFDTQPDFYDYIAWMVSTDGSNFSGYGVSGSDATWYDISQDLATDPWLGNLCGEDEVWVAFWFYSDSATTAEGAYIDDVGLRKDVGCEWLSVLPNSGTVAPAGYDDLTVTVDTTGMSPSTGGCPGCGGGEAEGTLEFMSQEEVAVSPGEVNAEGVTTITQAAYTWQPSSPSPSALNILVYADDAYTSAGNTYVELALQALGLSYTGYYNDYAGFGNALTTGGPWDLVLVSHNNWYALGNYWTEIEDYVNAGGQVVIETFDIDGSDSEATTLWDTLGVSQVSDMSTMQSLYRWEPTHPIFTLIESVPDMTTITHAYTDDGDKCDPVSPTIAVAGFTGSETAGQGGIFCGSIVNSFVVSEFRGDDDTDGTLDAVELWMNEIAYVATYALCGDICCDIVINSNDPDEDPVVVPVCVSVAIDFGDAPDPSYPSLRASDGARHIPGNIWLGTAPTAELDSLQVDLDANDDGVTFLGSSPVSGGPYTLPYVPGQYGAVQVVVGGASIDSCLHGWIDWNQDGTWANSPDLENIFTSYLATGPGTYVIEFPVPATALTGPTWSRFRIDEPAMMGDGELESGVMAYRCLNSPLGLALNGEVEDYPVGVEYIPPEGWSSDDIGAEVNAYCEFEDVYTTGSSFPHDTNVDIHILPDLAWSDGMGIPGDVSSDGYNTVMTDSDGNLGPALIWPAPVDPGEYDIVFDANQNGVYDALIDYVDHPNHPGFIISECPIAAFTASPTSGSAPLAVQFTDLSTGDIASWLWYFGDGESSRAQHPSHVYNYEGTYLVTLIVEGPCGEDVDTGYIEVIEEVAPARIIVRNLQIEPAQALPGQQVVVSADVVNQGGIRGSKRIDLVINGYAEQAVRVGVDPGAAEHVTFYTSKTVPGTYEVFIEGQASAFNVFLRPRVTTSTGVAGGLGTGAIIAIVVIGIIFLVGIIIVFIRVRRPV